MPLDEFKTQVLLLHSEQSALDSMGAGFSDNYTVHYATSGSEALNTLVETPINIIVTAQELPGMSGLEALREAKKRSPDTVGILLADNADEGLEALVGDEEVFQVVRGNVSSDAIIKLVENATRQMRLMALAESANDTAANPDEMGAEHIVMETSDNGSTIISDGTGRLPALDPQSVSAAASVGSRAVDVLVLTKDQEFLDTVRESARGLHKVYYTNTLAQADEAIRKHKVGVAVVDSAMVGEKVEQLTQHLRKGSPRLVSIVAGRRDDGEMLMDLINRGKVYRFLLKPVSPGRARLAVEASVKYHLEAPDAAFVPKGAAAASIAAKPQPKAPPKQQKPQDAPKPAAKPVAEPPRTETAPKPAPAPEPLAKTEQTANIKVDPPLEKTDVPTTANKDDGKIESSPIDDGLGDAFSDNESSFSETVTGIFTSVSDKLGGSDSTKTVETKTAESVDSATETGGPSWLNPKLIGVGAVVLVAAIGAFFFMGSGDKEATSPTVADTQSPEVSRDSAFEVDTGATTDDNLDIDALLEEARLARDAGQIYDPIGNNAIELLAIAKNAAPGDAEIDAEFQDAIATALSMAESAMLESRLDDASAALARVSDADPAQARLPFLSAQLQQAQLRSRIDSARLAIRENRFEDASAALASARGLGVADSTELDTVEAELAAARSDQEVGDVLALAAARVDSGDLLSPANDNARYYYQLALSNDPANTAARQGLNIVASKIVLQARAAIDRGDFNSADDLLSDARQIDAANSEVATTISALASARAAVAERNRQTELAATAVREQAAANAEAERLAQLQAAAEVSAVDATDNNSGELAGAESESAGNVDPSVSSTTEDVADATGELQAANAEAPPKAQLNDSASSPNSGSGNAGSTAETTTSSFVAISQLDRTKYVAPKYPRNAQRRNVSGWVDVVFTVSADGSTKDVEVRDSEPGEIFVNSATTAVSKWEFEPVVENGAVVEKRAGVRMMFALED